MGRVFKILLSVLGGFLTLFILAAVAVYLFFDPNDFREEISASVKKQTGRDLTIEGDISLELFPWLAVEVGRTSLGNAPGFGDEPMASFESASFSVRLIPAIVRQEIEIGTASIESLRLNLAANADGSNNWADLAPEEGEAEAAPDPAGESSGSVNANSIRIVDASLTYSDAATGDLIVLEGMNLDVGRLQFDGTAVPVQAGLGFDVQPAGIAGNISLETVFGFDVASGLFKLDDLSLEGVVEGIAAIPTDVALRTDGIEVQTKESQVSMQPLDLSALDMRIVADVKPFSYAEAVRPSVDFEIDAFSPRSLMTLFEVAPPETADPSALSRVSVKATAKVTAKAYRLNKVVLKLDDTTFKGSLSVPSGEKGAIQFELTGDTIQLARYMAPASDSAPSGEEAPVEIPSDLIRPLNVKGSFQMERVSLGNMNFDNIEVGLRSNKGKLRLFPLSSDLFGGSYNGDVQINVAGKQPRLSVNEKIAGVDLAQLAKAMFDQDNITGKIEGAFELDGKGEDLAAIQRSLSGTMAISLADGAFQGTDVWYELRKARAALKGEQPLKPQLPAKTDFNNMRMTGVVKKGVLNSDDLFVELPFMQLTGAGQVDIPAATVNYGLSARVLERPEFMQSATPEEIEDFTEVVIPLRVSGPLASPSVRPDLEKLLQDKVEEEIKDVLKDKLKDLFD